MRAKLCGWTLPCKSSISHVPLRTACGARRDALHPYFDYGWWKAVMIKGNIRSIRLRQLAAPALVAGLVWSIVFAILRDPWLSWPIPLAYLLFLALGSAYVTWRRRDVTGFLLPVVLPFMHVGWGLGFLISTLRLASTLKFSNGLAARL